MNWFEFHHEAMAADFALFIAGHTEDYARQAATTAWRELDRLENDLSRFIESSDIARANRLALRETIAIGDDTLNCLLLAAEVSVATDGAFDATYASERIGDQAPFTLDPGAHTLTSHAHRLRLDLGAIGKGYALDQLAALLRDWDIVTACLQSGGSTALALTPPPGHAGWHVGIGEMGTPLVVSLTDAALSGSGIAVKGEHLLNPRTRSAAARTQRVWALAPSAALSDALSTAFFVMSDQEIAAFCERHPDIGAAFDVPGRPLSVHGTLVSLVSPTDTG